MGSGGQMRSFVAGFVAASALLVACAAAPVFPYRFYNLSGVQFGGTLLGPTPQDDIPFSQCSPVNGKQQCVVVFYTELNALISDYKQTKSDLISCQHGR